jgi:CBS domain-containing protein
MTVGEICQKNVVVAPKTEMIVDAAKRMRTSHVGDLIIVEARGERHVPVGILTDRDIVVSGLAGDPARLTYLLVSDLMSDDLITAEEHESTEAALMKMQEHGVRRLPIVDSDGTLVGIVTLDDILQFFSGQQNILAGLVTREQQRERQHRV